MSPDRDWRPDVNISVFSSAYSIVFLQYQYCSSSWCLKMWRLYRYVFNVPFKGSSLHIQIISNVRIGAFLQSTAVSSLGDPLWCHNNYLALEVIASNSDGFYTQMQEGKSSTHLGKPSNLPAVAQALIARLAARIPRESVPTPSSASFTNRAATSFISVSDLSQSIFRVNFGSRKRNSDPGKDCLVLISTLMHSIAQQQLSILHAHMHRINEILKEGQDCL